MSLNDRLQNLYIIRQVFYESDNDAEIEKKIESLLLKEGSNILSWLQQNDQKIKDYHQFLFLNIMKIRGIFLDVQQQTTTTLSKKGSSLGSVI